MQKDYLAIELAKIESDAAELTAALLANQDAFLRGHALAELLVAHGAPAHTALTVVAHSVGNPGYIIYATVGNNSPDAVFNALQDSRAAYRIVAGYSDEVRYALVDGYEGVKIALPASIFQPLQVAA